MIVSGAAYALLYAPLEWVWLSWFVLVPLYLAIRARGAAVAAGQAALWSYVATVAVISWLVPTLTEHFERSFPASLAFLLLFGAVAASPFFAVSFGACGLAARRLPGWALPLLWVAAWVGAEYARTQLGFRSPWAKLGDAHYGSERLRQIADLTGVYGVSGVVALGNAAVAEFLRAAAARLRDAEWELRAPLVTGAAFALVLGMALVYGEGRRLPDPRVGSGFDVAVVQGNVPPSLRWSRSSASRVLRRYGKLTLEVLGGDPAPDLVVWPENAIQTPPSDPTYGPPLRGLVARGAPLLIGAPRSEVDARGRRHRFNSAHLLGTDRSARHYDKRRLLAFSESRPFGLLDGFGSRGDLDTGSYTPGRRPGFFALGDEQLGVLICFEAIYPELGREAAQGGASVLVNLSNDGWYRGRGGARQHLALAVFRAIETGLPLVRSTTTGISAVVAPDGAVVASLGEGETGTLRRQVPPPRPRGTAYVRHGDWFAAGSLLLCALAPAVRMRPRTPPCPGDPPAAAASR